MNDGKTGSLAHILFIQGCPGSLFASAVGGGAPVVVYYMFCFDITISICGGHRGGGTFDQYWGPSSLTTRGLEAALSSHCCHVPPRTQMPPYGNYGIKKLVNYCWFPQQIECSPMCETHCYGIEGLVQKKYMRK